MMRLDPSKIGRMDGSVSGTGDPDIRVSVVRVSRKIELRPLGSDRAFRRRDFPAPAGPTRNIQIGSDGRWVPTMVANRIARAFSMYSFQCNWDEKSSFT